MTKGLIYLASPYSDSDSSVMEYRFKVVCRVAARLMREGEHIFSPIAHTHPIAVAGELPKGWEFWKGYDEAMLTACSEMKIVAIPGWENSKGIAAETAFMAKANKPISWIYPTSEELSA